MHRALGPNKTCHSENDMNVVERRYHFYSTKDVRRCTEIYDGLDNNNMLLVGKTVFVFVFTVHIMDHHNNYHY